jgi:hypothetical protein
MTVSEDELTYAHLLRRLDAKGRTVSELASFPYSLNATRIRGGAAVVTGPTHYEAALQLAKLSDGLFAYGYSAEYGITVMNDAGEVLKRFRKEEPAPRFTAEERQVFKRAPLPSQKPYFFNLLSDSLGRIYVQRNNAFGRVEVEVREKEVDVFDREGRFLYQTRLPANTRVIRDGYLYCFEVNEDEGMEYVKRYKITNWSGIARMK